MKNAVLSIIIQASSALAKVKVCLIIIGLLISTS